MAPPSNQILLSLPLPTLERLRPDLELVEIKRKQVVDRAGELVEYIYFPNRGLISLVQNMRDGRVVEIGVVGTKGLTNAHSLLGLSLAPVDAVVQIPGEAFRIKRRMLRDHIEESDSLRDALEKYGHFALLAFAQTAACNRLHHLEERCCRWLLIGHDSARSDTFELTHEFLAMMLGVQRSGLSITANILQREGLIRYKHGRITIVNRSGLEQGACECYGVLRVAYDNLFKTLEKTSG